MALIHVVVAVGDEPVSMETLADEYERNVRPLLTRFCVECHSTEQQEGDLDLEQFATLAEVRRGPPQSPRACTASLRTI